MRIHRKSALSSKAHSRRGLHRNKRDERHPVRRAVHRSTPRHPPAYARRHQACLSVDEIKEWLEAGRKDPTKREIVTEGMERVIEVLTAFGIEPAKKSAI
jgi:hypothetical protein